jgi:hypothetical protein
MNEITKPRVHLISRPEAVDQLADLIRNRGHYIVPIHPEAPASRFVYQAGAWSAFVDNGTETVLLLTGSGPDGGALNAVLMLTAGYVTTTLAVAKVSTPARALSTVLETSADVLAKQDIVITYLRNTEDGKVEVCYPLLFIDAVDRCDPMTAASLRNEGQLL